MFGSGGINPTKVWDSVRAKLEEHGIDLEGLCCGELDPTRMKVVCVTPSLRESVKEMSEVPRGETVMVRLDEETRKSLDAWVETGYVKSRSEAAALFIREGLKVRAAELAQLTEALEEVKRAKSNLRDKARELFGESKES